jgi:hypothetical protein
MLNIDSTKHIDYQTLSITFIFWYLLYIFLIVKKIDNFSRDIKDREKNKVKPISLTN